MPKRVIVVTDGDDFARDAVEAAAASLGITFLAETAGNPTPLSGDEIVQRVLSTPADPVIIMVDDRGRWDTGGGETALRQVASHPDIDLIGALAVASNTPHVHGVRVDCSLDSDGNIVDGSVDKDGEPEAKNDHVVEGDTVDVLEELHIPVVVGIGDIGKMDGADSPHDGARLTTKAFEELLKRAGVR